MVSGAAWSDLDQDGYPELILACEWGPVRIFRNQAGRLTSWDPPVKLARDISDPHPRVLTLSQLTGWWHSVATGDFNGNGSLDIVAGNWGLNDAYQAGLEEPLHLYHGNLAGGGLVDLIESYHVPELAGQAPRRSLSALARAMRPEWPRLDGGRGLWLRGDGQGRFEPVSSRESGIEVFGEQRGAAWGDFNGDGRVDLVVTQNGAATRLFENVGGRPGLRVRLKGPPGNPWGIGAVMRLGFGNRLGPAREVKAGSGYWSQDSLVHVLGCPEPPDFIHILWPGGKRTSHPIPIDASEVTVAL